MTESTNPSLAIGFCLLLITFALMACANREADYWSGVSKATKQVVERP